MRYCCLCKIVKGVGVGVLLHIFLNYHSDTVGEESTHEGVPLPYVFPPKVPSDTSAVN